MYINIHTNAQTKTHKKRQKKKKKQNLLRLEITFHRFLGPSEYQKMGFFTGQTMVFAEEDNSCFYKNSAEYLQFPFLRLIGVLWRRDAGVFEGHKLHNDMFMVLHL